MKSHDFLMEAFWSKQQNGVNCPFSLLSRKQLRKTYATSEKTIYTSENASEEWDFGIYLAL